MSPLEELAHACLEHSIVCRCGLCRELFWRLCIERGGVDREHVPELLEIFELYRWTVAAGLLGMFRAAATFEADAKEAGAKISLSLRLQIG
jgi:hypothetical protein